MRYIVMFLLVCVVFFSCKTNRYKHRLKEDVKVYETDVVVGVSNGRTTAEYKSEIDLITVDTSFTFIERFFEFANGDKLYEREKTNIKKRHQQKFTTDAVVQNSLQDSVSLFSDYKKEVSTNVNQIEVERKPLPFTQWVLWGAVFLVCVVGYFGFKRMR